MIKYDLKHTESLSVKFGYFSITDRSESIELLGGTLLNVLVKDIQNGEVNKKRNFKDRIRRNILNQICLLIQNEYNVNVINDKNKIPYKNVKALVKAISEKHNIDLSKLVDETEYKTLFEESIFNTNDEKENKKQKK